MKDYIKLTFRNGSVLDISGAIDSTRGERKTSGLIDEVRDQNADDINEIVLPLLNVDRRTLDGRINPKEPHKAQLYMSSAAQKSTYCYEKLIELFEQSIISPHTTFVWGCSYQVPMMVGLLDKTYINELKMSPTFKVDSFAREYLGIFSGGGTDSWFDFDKISKNRIVVNPETHRKNENDKDFFYLISVDVGRAGDQTAVSIFKVYRREPSFRIKLCNLIVLGRTDETRHFEAQALELKKLIRDYDPIEVVVDGNGLGIGFTDFLSRPQRDPHTGEDFPAYGSFNDPDMQKTQPKDAIKLLYIIKANGKLNSDIHSNCYTMVTSGKVKFLIKEQDAKNKLMATKVGQKMSIEDKTKRLMPHEMTTRLLEEMANLRLRQSASTQEIALEQINSRFGKDKYSSFSYGLYRIKQIEEEYQKRRAKHSQNRKLVFYTPGG